MHWQPVDFLSQVVVDLERGRGRRGIVVQRAARSIGAGALGGVGIVGRAGAGVPWQAGPGRGSGVGKRAARHHAQGQGAAQGQGYHPAATRQQVERVHAGEHPTGAVSAGQAKVTGG